MIDYYHQQKPMGLGHPARFLSTIGGIGHFPFMPGTIGSLVAVPAAWGILTLGGKWGHGVLFLAALVVFLIGVIVSSVYETRTQRHDPKEVIIDEVAGQWFALAFAQPQFLWHFAVGFVLFRFFDITKIWPANWAQRMMPGGWGIMLDDVIAAVWSAGILYGVILASEDPQIAGYVKELIDEYIKEYL